MKKTSRVLLGIGLFLWVALYQLWHVFNDQWYFIGQALMMFIVSIIFIIEFKAKICYFFLFLSSNQLIDEITMNALSVRLSEFISCALALLIIFKMQNKKQCKTK